VRKLQTAEPKNEALERIEELPTFSPKSEDVPRLKFSTVELKIPEKRRRSFDKNAWQSISLLRTAISRAEDHDHQSTPSPHRAGRLRSRSFHLDGGYTELSSAEKHVMYGNNVQMLNLIQKDLTTLRLELLRKLQADVRADRVDCFFVQAATDELLIYFKGAWHNMRSHAGLPGEAARSGQLLTVVDLPDDSRYDSALDKALQSSPSCSMCVAVRANRGGGAVVAVLQASRRGEGFSGDDEDTLRFCAQRVSEELTDRLSALQLAASVFLDGALSVGHDGDSHSHFLTSTAISRTHASYASAQLHDLTLAEHTGAFTLRGASSADKDSEKLKLLRRQNFSPPAPSSPPLSGSPPTPSMKK
jgi:hypothetical protein